MSRKVSYDFICMCTNIFRNHVVVTFLSRSIYSSACWWWSNDLILCIPLVVGGQARVVYKTWQSPAAECTGFGQPLLFCQRGWIWKTLECEMPSQVGLVSIEQKWWTCHVFYCRKQVRTQPESSTLSLMRPWQVSTLDRQPTRSVKRGIIIPMYLVLFWWAKTWAWGSAAGAFAYMHDS